MIRVAESNPTERELKEVDGIIISTPKPSRRVKSHGAGIESLVIPFKGYIGCGVAESNPTERELKDDVGNPLLISHTGRRVKSHGAGIERFSEVRRNPRLFLSQSQIPRSGN